MFDLYGCEFLLDVLEGLHVDRVDFGCGAVFAFSGEELHKTTAGLREQFRRQLENQGHREVKLGCDAVAYHVIHVSLSCY